LSVHQLVGKVYEKATIISYARNVEKAMRLLAI